MLSRGLASPPMPGRENRLQGGVKPGNLGITKRTHTQILVWKIASRYFLPSQDAWGMGACPTVPAWPVGGPSWIQGEGFLLRAVLDERGQVSTEEDPLKVTPKPEGQQPG